MRQPTTRTGQDRFRLPRHRPGLSGREQAAREMLATLRRSFSDLRRDLGDSRALRKAEAKFEEAETWVETHFQEEKRN